MSLHYRIFEDRTAAGAALARQLQRLALRPPMLVLGLPRGGVPVAFEVARLLEAPLDVMLVRRIGMPGQPELAIGAIAFGGVVIHEPRMEKKFPDLTQVFNRLVEAERMELERRERVYRRGLPPLELNEKTVILVDDGLATGSTMLAAIRGAHRAGAGEIIVAAPVGSREATTLIRAEADAAVILETPTPFLAIGQWYRHFQQPEDAEVCHLLEQSRLTTEASEKQKPSDAGARQHVRMSSGPSG